jgi:3-isopropylmalate/(R)-2-methylmalate dehydratase small subunit
MEPFKVLRAIAAPLLRENVDTDIIIRIERLVGTSVRGKLGPYCFGSLRTLPDGRENPDFVLNREPYRQAQILLAGPNFACGSSREGAVWALMEAGIRCVIAPSFGDIFFNNCFQNGLLPVVLDWPAVQMLARQVELDPAAHQVTVDLRRRVVMTPEGEELPFHVEALRRESMLAGLDGIGATLARAPEIAAFQARDRTRRPWIHLPPGAHR